MVIEEDVYLDSRAEREDWSMANLNSKNASSNKKT